MSRIILVAIVFLYSHSYLYGQNQVIEGVVATDTTAQDTLSIIHMSADTGLHVSFADREVDTLIKNVILTQDSIAIYCNLAIVIDQINARAYEDVVIIHHDTIQIYADSMTYDGQNKIADLYGEVILQDGDRRLFTSELRYNVNDKTAFYLNGGTLVDGLDTIVSKEGYYYQREQQARLIGNVSFVDTSRTMLTDSILYLYNLDQLNIIAPTQIIQDSVDIYCESGIYRLKQDRGVLSQNVQVRSGDQLMTAGILDINGAEDKYVFLIDPILNDDDNIGIADTIVYYDNEGVLELRSNANYTSPDEVLKAPVIRYDKETDSYNTFGRARIETKNSKIEADDITSEDNGGTRLKGKVEIYDKESEITINSEEAVELDGVTKMYHPGKGQPLLTYELSSDSLLLRSDSLIITEMYADTDSTSQELTAVNKVKWKNGTTLGKSNKFLFYQQDSVIIMTDNPILWSDSTQLSADTIMLFLKNNDVYKITLIDNAMIISPDNTGMYNQIKGAKIENFIEDKALVKSHVMTNAELLYMIKEDESYRGVDVTKSNEMIFTFEDDQIVTIDMNGQPSSNMYEYTEGMDLTSYNLDGFKWRFEERPSADIFKMQL